MKERIVQRRGSRRTCGGSPKNPMLKIELCMLNEEACKRKSRAGTMGLEQSRDIRVEQCWQILNFHCSQSGENSLYPGHHGERR